MLNRNKVTIEDVAEAAGVSRQTVSRVINNSPNVRPVVRERIEAAIEELGYAPNLAARRMGGSKSFLILAINDRARTLENWKAGRGNDWVDQMLYGGMTECEKHGYHMVFELIDPNDASAPRQLSGILASLQPDGVILTPPHCDNRSLVELLEARSIPYARVGHCEGKVHVDVYMDEQSAARDATNYLISLGHKRLAFIAGSPTYGNSPLRIKGFQSAIREAGLSPEAGIVGTGNFHFDTAAECLGQLLSSPTPPTAVIADNDEMAFAAMHVASLRGLRIPDQLSVMSFEDTPGVRFSVPPLSAIRQPTAAMIATACEKLIKIARGEQVQGAFELPYLLVKRASTGRPEG